MINIRYIERSYQLYPSKANGSIIATISKIILTASKTHGSESN